MGSLLVNI